MEIRTECGSLVSSGVCAEVDDALGGLIAELIEVGDIKGKRGEITLVYTLDKLPARRVLVLGLGKRDKLSPDVVRALVADVARYLRGLGVDSFATPLLGTGAGLDAARIGRAMAEGILLGLYRFNNHISIAKESSDRSKVAYILAEDEQQLEALRSGVEHGQILGEATNLARDMANEPSNYMTPTELAARARQVADEAGLECLILDREDMIELGMGALLGVAKGSHEEPRFIVLSYRGDSREDSAIGLLGKGITFDTGGISIKPAQGMEEMKGDMSGGAAIKPGDVLVAMSGETIEVINTDAEGRLVLADAIAYAKRLELSPIIDVATLTGAIGIALGDVAVGLVGNDQTLVDEIVKAGQEAGEKLWQLPLYDEYREQIKSDVADIKNTGGRKAGALTAAWFLAEFAEQTPWAHLDIAGVDTYEHDKGWIVKGASGIPVRTLINFVLNRARRRPDALAAPAQVTAD